MVSLALIVCVSWLNCVLFIKRYLGSPAKLGIEGISEAILLVHVGTLFVCIFLGSLLEKLRSPCTGPFRHWT